MCVLVCVFCADPFKLYSCVCFFFLDVLVFTLFLVYYMIELQELGFSNAMLGTFYQTEGEQNKERVGGRTCVVVLFLESFTSRFSGIVVMECFGATEGGKVSCCTTQHMQHRFCFSYIYTYTEDRYDIINHGFSDPGASVNTLGTNIGMCRQTSVALEGVSCRWSPLRVRFVRVLLVVIETRKGTRACTHVGRLSVRRLR